MPNTNTELGSHFCDTAWPWDLKFREQPVNVKSILSSSGEQRYLSVHP